MIIFIAKIVNYEQYHIFLMELGWAYPNPLNGRWNSTAPSHITPHISRDQMHSLSHVTPTSV